MTASRPGRGAPPSVMTPARMEEIKRLAASGLNLTRIADTLGIPRSTLFGYLARHPIPVPAKGKQPSRKPRVWVFTPEMVARIHEAHAAGMYLAEAARHLGLNTGSLVSWNGRHRVWEAPSRSASMKAWCEANPDEVRRLSAISQTARAQSLADKKAARAAKIAAWVVAVDRRERA